MHRQSADQKMLRTVVLSSSLNPTKFDVTMAVEIRIQVFWSMTSFLHVSGYWSFRDTYCLHLRGRNEPNMDVGTLQKIGLW